MADILQIPSGGSTTGTFNSGIPLLDVIKGTPIGIILFDPGVGLSAAERADWATTLAAIRTKSRAARGSRCYPLWVLTNFEDKSKEATKAALGNLTNAEITTNEGTPAFSFQHRKGEIFHNLLMAAEAAGLTVMIVDSKYVLYGTLDGTLFRGYTTSEFKVSVSKFGNNSTASIYPFDITLDNMREYKENGRFIQGTSALVSVGGIRNIVLSKFSAVGSVLKVGLTGDGGKNITDIYSTELLQAGAWVVTNVGTGLTATITPTFDSVNKVIILTLSGTPWTGAATNDPFTCNLVSSAALAALASPIDGYESTGAFTFLKP